MALPDADVVIFVGQAAAAILSVAKLIEMVRKRLNGDKLTSSEDPPPGWAASTELDLDGD